ncbi:MAG: Nramp family divalent metal transporter [Gemmatimonadota bacterium]
MSGERTSGWARALDRVRWLGPGLVVAATAIGASHLVLAPTAGALFGYGLLWVILFSHLFKYPAFEFGPRYAVATGTSLLAGYRRMPGPAGWALWVFLAGTVIQGVTVLAGVLGVAAAVAAVIVPIPGVSIPLWSLLLGLVVAGLLRTGGFDGLSALSKWMLLILSAMTAVAFVARPPGSGFWTGLLVPDVPTASVLLVGALLGWMPTGIDVAVWHSMWALERRTEWEARAGCTAGAPEAPGSRSPSAPDGTKPRALAARRPGELHPSRVLAVGLLDMRLGYGLSFLLGTLFVALGAEVLGPAGVTPQGAQVAVTIARLYTDVLGPWIFPLFLAAAFFGMFSTAYGVLDGFPRAFAATVGLLRPSTASRRTALYWGFLLGSLALAAAETALLPDPVLLVTVAAVISFLLSSLLYALNHYCVTHLIPDPELRPGRGLRLWSLAGIGCMAGATLFFLWARLAG